MKTKNYFIIPVLALLTASSCQNEDRNWQPATGEEVRFGATLEQKAGSRTIYGEENTVNGTFPIYWVNGDEVIVSSPECGARNGVGTANIISTYVHNTYLRDAYAVRCVREK